MKSVVYLIIFIAAVTSVSAQEFDKNLTVAKSSYSSGDLEGARFAIQQMLGDVDMMIGKEILSLLPTKLGGKDYNSTSDQVTGGSGMATGLFVHRSYGTSPSMANLEIINNSPLINSINTILTMPMMGAMVQDENQKVIRVQGYKGLLNKSVNTETGKTGYELQLPMNNTLLTLRQEDTSEAEITSQAESLPLAQIVKLAQ